MDKISLNPTDKENLENNLALNPEEELTDEQLLEMAEGSCTWGANCGK